MGENNIFWAETIYAPGKLILMRMDPNGFALPYRHLDTYCFNYKNFESLQFTSFQAIPGEEDHQGCFVYDPEHFEFEEITAPVKNYAGVMKGYVDTCPQVMHTGKVLTEESFRAAIAVAEDLNKKLHKLELQKKQEEFDHNFELLSNNGIGKSLWLRLRTKSTPISIPSLTWKLMMKATSVASSSRIPRFLFAPALSKFPSTATPLPLPSAKRVPTQKKWPKHSVFDTSQLFPSITNCKK